LGSGERGVLLAVARREPHLARPDGGDVLPRHEERAAVPPAHELGHGPRRGDARALVPEERRAGARAHEDPDDARAPDAVASADLLAERAVLAVLAVLAVRIVGGRVVAGQGLEREPHVDERPEVLAPGPADPRV